MTDKRKPKSAAPAAKRAAKTKKTKAESQKPSAEPKSPRAEAKKPRAKTGQPRVGSKAPDAKTRKAKAETVAAPAAKHASRTKKTIGKAKEPGAKRRVRKAETGDRAGYRIGDPVLDPIGDVSSGEAWTYLGDAEPVTQAEMEAYRAETEIAAMDAGLEARPGMEAIQAAVEGRTRKTAEDAAALRTGAEASGELESGTKPHEPRKLERLQKILSQAGIASRRRAEEMIVAGRVMVNGQVVTRLGSKADATRDHIRVDGKLLQGAERRRYFLLNKPRGYVTTVSDPEGRPTVMQFFAGMHERLYPVGRLDYQSEGLLLMTNDGELANLLTKAGSAVEKTYLVKAAGQPSEEELERLRAGVAIERGEAGSERVRTAPARIRQVREGENPWYEVVLTEGRNRELRKMFAAIGHFAEKIRRVGYGPLALDVEPGKLRELTPDEVSALRLTAEGKMKPRRIRTDLMLPKEAGRAAVQSVEKQGARGGRPFRRRDGRGQKTGWWPKEREYRSPEGGEFRRSEKAGFGRGRGERRSFAPKPQFGRPAFPGRPQRERAEPKFEVSKRRPFRTHGERPHWKWPEETKRRFDRAPEKRFGAQSRGDWAERPSPGARGAGGKSNGAPGRRYESRSGFQPGGFAKAGGKEAGYQGKFGGGKRRGFRPPGKREGGRKRG